MTGAVTLNAFDRVQPALGRSFVLSLLVHLALGGVIFLGVRWQVSAPDTVTVDLVDELPPPAPVVEAPKPPPKVEPPPVVKPAPRVEKPQIVIPEKPKPKPKPEAKPKAEAKPKPKADPSFEKRFRDQMAAEQKALDQQRAERDLRDLLARQAAAARAKELNAYVASIQAAIRRKIRESELVGISGNPEAVFDVVQIPDGTVIKVEKRKSSGYPRYDQEVERAIWAAYRLPLPAQKELFSRELKLTFHPLDK